MMKAFWKWFAVWSYMYSNRMKAGRLKAHIHIQASKHAKWENLHSVAYLIDAFLSFLGTGHEGTLKRVHLPIVSNERCQQLHKGTLPITSSKLCAGGRRDEGVCEVSLFIKLTLQNRLLKSLASVSFFVFK